MNYLNLDILLLILLGVGFVGGLFSGAVKQVISLAAFVVGYVVASLYHERLGAMLTEFINYPNLCKVAAFALLWVAVPIVANLIASMLTSALDVLPAIGLLNRLLGGIIGMAKYALVLGALVMLFSSMHLLKEETMKTSKLCGPLKAVPEYIYYTIKNHSPKGDSANAARGDCHRRTRKLPSPHAGIVIAARGVFNNR